MADVLTPTQRRKNAAYQAKGYINKGHSKESTFGKRVSINIGRTIERYLKLILSLPIYNFKIS